MGDIKETYIRTLQVCFLKCFADFISSYLHSNHIYTDIDTLVETGLATFITATGMTPKFKIHGGTSTENLALQNIQARQRMVMSYLFAQLVPWTQGKQGALLVLGSANVDERYTWV